MASSNSLLAAELIQPAELVAGSRASWRSSDRCSFCTELARTANQRTPPAAIEPHCTPVEGRIRSGTGLVSFQGEQRSNQCQRRETNWSLTPRFCLRCDAPCCLELPVTRAARRRRTNADGRGSPGERPIVEPTRRPHPPVQGGEGECIQSGRARSVWGPSKPLCSSLPVGRHSAGVRLTPPVGNRKNKGRAAHSRSKGGQRQRGEASERYIQHVAASVLTVRRLVSPLSACSLAFTCSAPRSPSTAPLSFSLCTSNQQLRRNRRLRNQSSCLLAAPRGSWSFPVFPSGDSSAPFSVRFLPLFVTSSSWPIWTRRPCHSSTDGSIPFPWTDPSATSRVTSAMECS
jgi:hypothetical protein